MLAKKTLHSITAGMMALTIMLHGEAGHGASRSERDLRQEWIRERTIALHNDIEQCNILRENGLQFGRMEYDRFAPDCGTLFVNARSMAAILEDINTFFPLASRGHNQACYQSGWLIGYLESHNALFPTCESQLTTIQQQNIQARVKACEALGEKIAADSTTLGSIIVQTAEEASKAEAEKLAKDMFLLVSIGRSGEAWDLMLQNHRDELFHSLPCSVAIAMKLAD